MIISEGINHGKLQSIIVGELKKAGLKHRLKKIILKNLKDNKTVFGAPLSKVPSCSVICCGSTLSIPMIVTEMSAVLRRNAHIEGLFRKAGSQSRQKDIKRLLDAGGCVSEGHHPIDVASVLKLFLRHLPEPLISAEVQDLLLRCRLTAGDDSLKSILHTLLLLPVLHVHLLHYIMELLNFIASRHRDNLMDSSNLAIVLAPSIMPLPAAASAQRLEHHVALVKIFIENSKHIGVLTDELMSQLDDDSDIQIARQKKRRSGSINRVFNGLRKMVSNTINTPASVRENRKTPVIKSAAKRKMEGYDGLSAKRKNEIIQHLPNKEMMFTPMKLGLNERKKLRLSMMDTRGTPRTGEQTSHKNSETSVSSEDVRTSSEHLFTDHDTIDLSSDMKNPDKDYVRIPKQEYEEIKSRVSAIETRLSREFTDMTATRPGMEPFQEVQNVYEQTLEDVAMLDCPTSDNLARRLSRELRIRPNEHGKIIRSPSARKIGNIRRRSKENVPKIVRHKSWNVSSLSNQNVDRFYPYISLRRERTSTSGSGDFVPQTKDAFDLSAFNQHVNSVNQKYHLRKRSTTTPEHIANKTIGKVQKRRSLNSTINSSNNMTDNSLNNTNSSEKSDVLPEQYENLVANRAPKWKNAAAFFIDKTGEIESCNQTGRPSVNKLRSQNAGAVMAKAKMFETSSDKSSDWSAHDKLERNGFARKPRTAANTKLNRQAVIIKGDIVSNANKNRNVQPVVPPRSKYTTSNYDHTFRKKTSPVKMVSPKLRTPQSMKKPLVTPRTVRTSVVNEPKKANTPMKGIHNNSPRRRSPRQHPKLQRV